MRVARLASGVRHPFRNLRRAMSALRSEFREGPPTLERTLPGWAAADGPVPTDEIVTSPWMYHVLQMANRHFEPGHLAYHRTRYGEDHRIKYIAYFLDLRGLRTLELGPLEGHHSVLLEKMGVRENVAIEARTENMRKCARIKEKYGLVNTTFLQQNLENLYSGREQPLFSGKFDVVICLGVLYHLPDPVKALEWCRTQSDRLFLGTHYVEKDDPWRYPPEWFQSAAYEYRGKIYRTMQCREEGEVDPLSGMSPTSVWAYEDDLIMMLRDSGYGRISVLGKDLQNGAPHITILARS
jgi:SAM-dependent methyltransferase